MHEHPEKRLPADWADSFFRHNRSERMTPETEKATLIEELATLRTETTDKERRLAELLSDEQLAADQAAQRNATAAKLQELESRARATDTEAQALRAELTTKPKIRTVRTCLLYTSYSTLFRFLSRLDDRTAYPRRQVIGGILRVPLTPI